MTTLLLSVVILPIKLKDKYLGLKAFKHIIKWNINKVSKFLLVLEITSELQQRPGSCPEHRLHYLDSQNMSIIQNCSLRPAGTAEFQLTPLHSQFPSLSTGMANCLYGFAPAHSNPLIVSKHWLEAIISQGLWNCDRICLPT